MDWKPHAFLILGLGWGGAWAQAPDTGALANPLSAMSELMNGARQATQDVALMMTGQRLTDPTLLRDLSEVNQRLALLMRDMALYAESPQLTPEQLTRLETMLAESRLMLDQIIERARADLIR